MGVGLWPALFWSLPLVSIPSSSGMGVGRQTFRVCPLDEMSQYLLHQVWVSDVASDSFPAINNSLNTFFIRYGCRTVCDGDLRKRLNVSIPSSSGMGVGRGGVAKHDGNNMSQYLLHQVWVSDKLHFTVQCKKSGLNTFFIRYGCRTAWCGWVRMSMPVSIPSSSGMGVGRFESFRERQFLRLNTFFIRYGCRTFNIRYRSDDWRLNTFFIRYGCRTVQTTQGEIMTRSQYLLHQVWVSDQSYGTNDPRSVSLNTFFIRYGCRTQGFLRTVHRVQVSIPSSSGMGVGRHGKNSFRQSRIVSIPSSSGMGVGPEHVERRREHQVSIPSSSGMGVGPTANGKPGKSHPSQYLLHQVWVSDDTLVFKDGRKGVSIPSSSGMGVGPKVSGIPTWVGCLNTFFIRYGCRTVEAFAQSPLGRLNTFFIRYGCRTLSDYRGISSCRSQYLLHQVWVSDAACRAVVLGYLSQYLLHQVWVSD